MPATPVGPRPGTLTAIEEAHPPGWVRVAEWRPREPVSDLRQFTEAEKLDYWEDYVGDLAAHRGMKDPPETELQRWIRWDETGPVWGQCLAEFGYEVTYDPRPGMVGGPNARGDYGAKHEHLAYYTCMTRFAVDPTYMQPPTRDQARIVYEYMAEAYLPCVRELGYEVLDLPEPEFFVDSYLEGDSWSPWPDRGSIGLMDAAVECHGLLPSDAAYHGYE